MESDKELQRARQLLCLWTGQPVAGLAYPYGDFDADTKVTAARHAEWACSVTPDLVWKYSDPYALPRAWVPNLAGREFYEWLLRLGLS
jgi:peptidoglycan/xylan/chitin deacetylase (PgdA/CDA1 family)